MGITYVKGTVTGPTGTADVEFLVDSGATYSLLPHDVWQAVGIEPRRRMEFTLADGTHISRDIGECLMSLPEGDGTSPVILGEPGDAALLGVVTLEILGLVLNPFTRELQPMRMMLA